MSATTRRSELLRTCSTKAHPIFDTARSIAARLRMYQVTGHNGHAAAVGLQALALFGVTVPDDDAAVRAQVIAVHKAVATGLDGRRILNLIDAPLCTDAAAEQTMALLADALTPMYFMRPAVYGLLILKLVNMSLDFGNTPDSATGYAGYGVLLVGLLVEDFPASFEFSQVALRLNDKFGNKRLRGPLLFRHGIFINHWRRPLTTSMPYFDQAFQASQDAGDLVFASRAHHHIRLVVRDRRQGSRRCARPPTSTGSTPARPRATSSSTASPPTSPSSRLAGSKPNGPPRC